jgi:phosphoribosylformylglycinamidine synthase
VALRGDSFTALFSESAARALVSVVPGREREFAALADEHGVPVTVLGVTTGDSLTVEGVFQVPLTELRQVWSGTLPAIFG